MKWQALLENEKQRSALIEFTKQLPHDLHFKGNCQNIVVFSAPKSASSFITNTLHALFAYERVHLANADKTDLDHRLDAARIMNYKIQNISTLSQHHTIASSITHNILKRFDLIPIITSRGIAASLLSYRDMLNEQKGDPQFKVERKGFQFKKTDCFNDYKSDYFISRYYRLPPSEQLDMLIDQYANWYFQFWLSWKRLEAHRYPLVWIHYTDLVHDPIAEIRKVINFTTKNNNIFSDSQITDAISTAQRAPSSMVSQTGSLRSIDNFSVQQVERLIKIGCYHDKRKKILSLL